MACRDLFFFSFLLLLIVQLYVPLTHLQATRRDFHRSTCLCICNVIYIYDDIGAKRDQNRVEETRVSVCMCVCGRVVGEYKQHEVEVRVRQDMMT